MKRYVICIERQDKLYWDMCFASTLEYALQRLNFERYEIVYLFVDGEEVIPKRDL